MKKYFLLAIALLASASCNGDVTGLGPPSDPATETFAAALNVNISQMTRLPTGVYVQDSIVGTGEEITFQTDTVWVTYAGFLKDGKLFDSGNNVKFEPRFLVTGFRGGITGMKVGGRRKIVLPSDQGYGGTSVKDPTTGKIKIPRQSTLVFDVTLLKLHTPTGNTGPQALR
jgi:FKBP-type peptidyl-prolyl cis-trans isomerase FkpA